ncbi:MAG: DUF4831 family protein [Acidobacteriota bacterium]|nr:DUF4831 family protein [Acidobacteriota bacterium]
MRKKVFVLVLWILLFSGCATTHRVYRSTEAPPEVNGVYYSLPRTVMSVTVPVTQTIIIPGRYSSYAAEYLGQKVPQEKSRSYKVGVPVIGVRAEADPNHVYLVKINGGPLEQRQLELALNDHGLLTNAKTAVENKAVDFTINTVTGLANIAAKTITMSAGEKKLQEILKKLSADEKDKRQKIKNSWATLLFKMEASKRTKVDKIKLSEVMSMAPFVGKEKEKIQAALDNAPADSEARYLLSDTLAQIKLVLGRDPSISSSLQSFKEIFMIPGSKDDAWFEVWSLLGGREPPGKEETFDEGKKLWVIQKKDFKEALEPMERLAVSKVTKELADLKKKRQFIQYGLTTMANMDKDALEFLLEGIDKEIANLMQQLTYKKTTATWNAQFEIAPNSLTDGSLSQSVNLFAIDSKQGVVVLAGNMLLNSSPKGFVVKEYGSFSKPEVVAVQVNADPKETINQMVKGHNISLTRKKTGFFYRVPLFGEGLVVQGKMEGQNFKAKKTLARSEVALPQLGQERWLPYRTGSWLKSSYTFTLDPITGGITSLVASSDALNPAMVDSISGAYTTIQDAKAAKSAQEDKLAVLQREKSLLELEKAIAELKGESWPPP